MSSTIEDVSLTPSLSNAPDSIAAKPSSKFYHHHGSQSFKHHQSIRFKCQSCKKCFSNQSFHFSYRFKKPDAALSSKILNLFVLGSSNRQIAYNLNISEHCVRLRLSRMARWALIHHNLRLKRLSGITEALSYDGLENFAQSQYSPNYINQLIGRNSLFIYDFNFAPMNRKGYMSDRQKLHKHSLQTKLGKYPKWAIQTATTELLKRAKVLQADPHTPLVICSDEHFQYKRSFQNDLPQGHFTHITVSAKKTRNYQNILFPVNHADLLIRQRVGAFSRETISFSKTHARMCQKYALFMIHKNYMRAQFSKKQKVREQAHKVSPAQSLGLEKGLLKFGEFFFELRTEQQIEIPDEWKMIINNQVPYPRCKTEVN